MKAIAIACVILLAACGAEQGIDPIDAGSCAVSVQFEPADAVAPASITARAEVFGVTGVLTYRWTVTHGGASIATTPLTPDSRDIDFVADSAGIYDVVLMIDGGAPSCLPWQGQKNVRDPGATSHAVRLRFTAPSAAVPPQERIVVVPGGADFATGVIAIDPGTSLPIAVRDGGGALVPSYVRLTSRATPDATIELMTGSAGTDRVVVATGRYDALVVPIGPGPAPTAIANWDPATGVLPLALATAVTGRLLDGAGQPVAGARIAIGAPIDGAPSTVATTASDGSFTLGWQRGAGATLAVTPPAGLGLARLAVPLDELTVTRPLTIRYDAGHPARDLTGIPVRIGGRAATGGHVLFAVDLGAVATASDGLTTVTATGSHREQVAIDPTGHLAAFRLTAGSGRAFVVDSGGPGTVALFDATTSPPASLDGGAPRAVAIALTDALGAPLTEVVVRATIDGDLAHLGAPGATATTGVDGGATLVLAAGAGYDLTLADPRARGAVHHLRIGGTETSLGPRVIPSAIAITGDVRLVGQSTGLADTSVSALCAACTGLDRSRPLGETTSSAGGTFAVVVPDPSAP